MSIQGTRNTTIEEYSKCTLSEKQIIDQWINWTTGNGYLGKGWHISYDRVEESNGVRFKMDVWYKEEN